MRIVDITLFPRDFQNTRKQGKAVIGISLNNYVSRSLPSLCELFRWTHEHRGPFDLLVGDYMNRHNYQAFDRFSQPEAEQRALLEGSSATARLRKLLGEHGLQGISVIRAESFYADPSFQERLVYFRQVYETNKGFSDLIHEAIGAFLARKPNVIVTENIRHHCVAYQLEELVLFELLSNQGYTSLVYAGAQLPIMKSIVSGNMNGVSDSLKELNLVEIRFSRIQ